MVNNGASGACHACKQKRKKCDETRPSCVRCIRSRRSCPGYELPRKFINYSGEASSHLTHQTLDWPAIEQEARLLFFDDYCIVSTNQDLSRGYLNGLQIMIAEAGPNSELTQACTIASLANIGKKLGNTTNIERAKELYSSLLRSFRLRISNEAVFTTVESLITAALLGLYEIITSTDAYPYAHVAHARGVSAILISKFSPFDLMCGGKLFQVTNPVPLSELEVETSQSPSIQKLPQRFSVLCTPVFSQPNIAILDFVYAQTEPLMRRAVSLLASEEATLDQLRQLKLEAEQLIEAYNKWPGAVPEEWKPISVGVIFSKDGEVLPDIGYWPGIVSSYYDPYVASIWNSYRKACLLLLNITMSCDRRINSDTSIHKDIPALTEGIVSSIPYLLAADLQAFVENATEGSKIVPGRPVGALLSMYALYVLSTLPMVEENLKVYIKNCLAWIGKHMGIGQATILSKCAAMDQFEYTAEARVIIWTGMLI